MKKFIKKYLSVSKANLTDTPELGVGGEPVALKSRRQGACDPEKDNSIAKTHCKIVVQNGNKFLLTDLNSKNAAFVNGKKIRAQTPIVISAGDEIEFRQGGVKLSFEFDPDSQAQVKAALLGGQPWVREPNIDAGIVLSDLVQDPSFQTAAATCEEIIKPDIGKTAERLMTQAESNTREEVTNIAAGTRNIVGDFFSNNVFFSFYARAVFVVLGLVVGGSYFLAQLDFVPEKFEIETPQILTDSTPLAKEDIKEYAAFNNVLPVAALKAENVELSKENQPIANKNLGPPAPEAKQLVSAAQSIDIQKKVKKKSPIKNKKRSKKKPSAESSDPHIDAWAKEFFTN